MNWTILDSSRRRNKKLLALEEEVEHQIEVEADQGEDLPRESNNKLQDHFRENQKLEIQFQ